MFLRFSRCCCAWRWRGCGCGATGWAKRPGIRRPWSLRVWDEASGVWAVHAVAIRRGDGWQYHQSAGEFLLDGWLGFGFAHEEWATKLSPENQAVIDLGRRTLVIPYWFLFLLTAAPPAFVAFSRWRAAVRDRVGRCPGCGYDLRASPQRCPECGRPVA